MIWGIHPNFLLEDHCHNGYTTNSCWVHCSGTRYITNSHQNMLNSYWNPTVMLGTL